MAGCRLVDSALEILAGLPEPSGPEAVIRFPYGFRVVELGPKSVARRGWTLFLVRKTLASTPRAAQFLSRRMLCRMSSYAGLKDACSVSWQYISLFRCRRAREFVESGGVRAWRVGPGRYVYPGGHLGNYFNITLEAWNATCPMPPAWIPGHYGPQRFGVFRPSSHIYSLGLSLKDWPGLLNEYSYRYPLERRLCPGDYESRVLSATRKLYSPPPHKPNPIAAEALRSYIFNRALTLGLERGFSPQALAESYVSIPCSRQTYKVPAARLPSRRVALGSSTWSKLVAKVLVEEGLTPTALPDQSKALRPLAYPVCSFHCRQEGGGLSKVKMLLPPGAFATVALSTLYSISWSESYSECG